MTDARRNKILQIVMYATLLNNEPTKRDLTGDKPTVFCNFSGHVSLFEVRIYNHGWKSYCDADVIFNVSFDSEYSNIRENSEQREYPADETLKIALNRLKALYKEWEDKPCMTTD